MLICFQRINASTYTVQSEIDDMLDKILVNLRLNRIINSSFKVNVIKMMSGNVMGQALSVLAAPILTRLFTPEDLGLNGVFLTVASVIIPISALCYPFAMALTKDDEEASVLAVCSGIIGVILAGTTFVLLLFFGEFLARKLQSESIQHYLMLIPVVVLASSTVEILKFWLNRKEQFSGTAIAAFFNSAATNGAKVLGGFLSPTALSLILATTLGFVLHSVVLVYYSIKKAKFFYFVKKLNFVQLKKRAPSLLTQHKSFPYYKAPQLFLNSISMGLPVLMLTTFYGPASAGLYVIASRIIRLPTGILRQAMGDVFYIKIAKERLNDIRILHSILRVTLGLAAIAIIPFGLITAFGPDIFRIVFGEEWLPAGHYARWLSIWIFFMLINSPSVQAINVLEMQRFHLIFSIFSLLLRIGALYLGVMLYNDDLISIILFALAGALLNIFLISAILFNCKKQESARCI